MTTSTSTSSLALASVDGMHLKCGSVATSPCNLPLNLLRSLVQHHNYCTNLLVNAANLHKFGHPDTFLTLDFLYTDPSLTTGSSVLWESLSYVASTRNRGLISGELPPSASTDLELIDYSLMQPSAMDLSSLEDLNFQPHELEPATKEDLDAFSEFQMGNGLRYCHFEGYDLFQLSWISTV